MGSGLIGHLLKGPFDLAPSKKDEAVQVATRLRDAYKMVYDTAYGDEPFDFEHHYYALVQKAADRFGVELDSDAVDDEWALERTVLLDPKKVVESLYAVWDGDARDVVSRPDPDDSTTQLIFAGEPSWGDEPEGYGYETLRDSRILGLHAFFNIR